MPLEDSHISLAHGNGGRLMRELIEELFARHLANPGLDTRADAVRVELPAGDTDVLITTDGFTVQPLEYPGGSIGSLCVHGTVNDLAVAGATPRCLTLNAFIEEGLEIALLDRLVANLAAAAAAAGIPVVAGDTKILRRGEGGGVYFATTGLGTRPRGLSLGVQQVRARDAVLVSGPVGDHGTAVMLAREQFGLRGRLASDEASVLPLTQPLLDLPGLRFMRDPTRGGLATVAHEIARGGELTVQLDETAIPVRDEVRGVCAMLGYDPYYLACEGRVIAVVAPRDARQVLECWHAAPDGAEAAVIGALEAGPVRVLLRTLIGGERILEELEDDPLPRIC